jgi:hypothetical protein
MFIMKVSEFQSLSRMTNISNMYNHGNQHGPIPKLGNIVFF